MADQSVNIFANIVSGITLYGPYIIIIVGTIGAFCNLLLFTSRELRNDACAFYFLCSTICDLIYLWCGTLTRLMGDHYPYFVPSRSDLYCRLRAYINSAVPTICTYFILLTSINRCLLTSISRRQHFLVQLRSARWFSLLSILVWSVAFSFILICYQLQLSDATLNIYVCGPWSGITTTMVNIFFIFCTVIGLYSGMLIASFLTFKRVRAAKNRVQNTTNRQQGLSSIDRNLIKIVFYEVGIGFVVTLIRNVFRAYYNYTSSPNNANIVLINSSLEELTITIYYSNFAKAFPVNIITSPLFRQIFIKRLMKICRFKTGSINNIGTQMTQTRQ